MTRFFNWFQLSSAISSVSRHSELISFFGVLVVTRGNVRSRVLFKIQSMAVKIRTQLVSDLRPYHLCLISHSHGHGERKIVFRQLVLEMRYFC